MQERSFPKADMLLNICQLLDVSADWLLKGEMEYLDMTGLSGEENKLISKTKIRVGDRHLCEVKLSS